MKRSSFVLSSLFSEVALKRRSSKGGGILCCSFSFASSSSQYVSSSSSDAFLSRENARSTRKNHNRGKEERWRTTKARSFSSSQSNEKEKKKPNPRMSMVEAVSAAIGSFVIGSLAAYLIEQQEEQAAETEEEKEEETKMKENIDDDDGKIKKKKKKKNTWRRMFFKEAKAEAASVVGTAAPKAVKMYTRLDVAEHDSIEKRVWCSYKENVYDVTDFLDNHPGGRDLLLLAAGKDIEPFWRLYQAHVNSDVAMEMLKTLKIGELDLEKEPKVDVDETDPYKNDPERHPALKCHSAKPANMEPPLSLLRREYLTPSSLWFVLNHSPVPIIDAATHEITIVSGEQSQDNLNLLRTKAVINLEHLKKDFEKKTVVATVQCGGNRRGGLDLIKKSSGTGWGEGAISTAKFAGASLRDVLEVHAGINLHNYERLGIKHVIFYGADDMRASIPIEKALSPFGDVLLAYEMNDCEELPRDHGYPLRVIVPGHVGVRNVKWLSKIKLCSEEADGPWNRGIAYKGFGPGYSSVEGLNIDSVPTMQEMPIQSVVAEAENISLSLATASKNDDGEKRTVVQTSAKGFAWSGGGRAIIRVDVSANKGLSWQTATLKEGADQQLSKAWAWTFWEIDDLEIDASKLKPGDEIKVLVKAVDASYNAQPEGAAAIWNLRGLNNNSWHAFTVKVEE